MTIIIREVYQDPSQAGWLSFPPKGLEGVRPYVSDKVFKLDAEYAEGAEEELALRKDITEAVCKNFAVPPVGRTWLGPAT